MKIKEWGWYQFGQGGAYATVSVANIDSDDNPEIIVPSMYRIYVFDYYFENGEKYEL